MKDKKKNADNGLSPATIAILNKKKQRLRYARLIDRCGGVPFFHKKWRLSRATVQNWKERGVPRKHWSRFMREFGVRLEELV